MKNSQKIVLIIVSALIVLTGCSRSSLEISLVTKPCMSPEIVASISGAIPQTFEIGDAIGIYPVGYKNGLSVELGTPYNEMNVRFTYNGIDWDVEPGRELFLKGDIPLDIYAYYPYDKELSNIVNQDKMNLYSYPYDVSGDQNLKVTDMLWAKTERVSVGNNTVGMIFRHVLSKIRINIFYDTPQINPEIFIYNTDNKAYIDLSTGRATLVDDTKGIIIPKLISGDDYSQHFSYEAIVIPQTLSAQTPIFLIKFGEQTRVFLLEADIYFEPQTNYIINLIVGTAESVSRLGYSDKIQIFEQ